MKKLAVADIRIGPQVDSQNGLSARISQEPDGLYAIISYHPVIHAGSKRAHKRVGPRHNPQPWQTYVYEIKNGTPLVCETGSSPGDILSRLNVAKAYLVNLDSATRAELGNSLAKFDIELTSTDLGAR